MLLSKLAKELTAAGVPVSGGLYITSEGVLGHHDAWTPEQESTAAAIIAAHDPTDYAQLRREAAPAELLQSPLAKMTYDEAAAWIDTNVSTVATARTALKALARMVIALRNQQMSEYLD